MRELKKHSFLILLIMSIVIVSLCGYMIGTAKEDDAGYEGSQIAAARAVHYWKDRLMHPEIPDVLPVSIVIGEEAGAPAQSAQEGETAEETQEEIKEEKEEKEKKPKEKDGKEPEEETPKEETPKEEAPKEEEPKEDVENPDFQLVDESYFEDALFIGDSRVVGFGLYSGLDKTTVYAHKGFQIYTFQTKQLVDTPTGKITVPEALLLQQGLFKKVYIMFGLNEMGWGTDEQFAQYYYNVIDTVKGTQPDAVVYVQSIMHVTKEKSESSPVYSNEAIDARNEQIKKIALNENVYYLDLNEIFTDEDGALPVEFSGDGVHLKAMYIELWKQYLMAHGIVREESVE